MFPSDPSIAEAGIVAIIPSRIMIIIIGIVNDFIKAIANVMKPRAQCANQWVGERRGLAKDQNGSRLEPAVSLLNLRQRDFPGLHRLRSAAVYSTSSSE